MKVNLELDLTPEELRRLFGLPDVSPINDMLVEKLGEQAEKGLDGTLLKNVAQSMVKGGALELERAIVHPALSDLDANVIDELRDALLTGWKTKEDRVLANYLSDL